MILHMPEPKKKVDIKKVDTKEFELPDTLFVRDIENRVFQGIVAEVLSNIEGVSLVCGTFIDNILGRGGHDSSKAIFATQDQKSHSVRIKMEINIAYGVSIPEKAEEIQTKVSEEITRLTGLHVAAVHVVFKDIIPDTLEVDEFSAIHPPINGNGDQDYNDEF